MCMFEEAQKELRHIINDRDLRYAPLLILCNKQDLKQAIQVEHMSAIFEDCCKENAHADDTTGKERKQEEEKEEKKEQEEDKSKTLSPYLNISSPHINTHFLFSYFRSYKSPIHNGTPSSLPLPPPPPSPSASASAFDSSSNTKQTNDVSNNHFHGLTGTNPDACAHAHAHVHAHADSKAVSDVKTKEMDDSGTEVKSTENDSQIQNKNNEHVSSDKTDVSSVNKHKSKGKESPSALDTAQQHANIGHNRPMRLMGVSCLDWKSLEDALNWIVNTIPNHTLRNDFVQNFQQVSTSPTTLTPISSSLDDKES
ncbi:hypothetical protein RFI_12608 [Reticulomyxa filosa]|uniref:Uncharacterized protein n=1 Tax=Reticulomyxa filosa TaxID=46433 RepID=X6NEX7_RETFI|nr:hypothetical protein RFI_12608 [Reticulomyxa filosa]|eukprot:ETO24551.1 hypothetical protein RFI_12608 [Reticulomyxa filosa]